MSSKDYTVGREYVKSTIGRTGYGILSLVNDTDGSILIGNIEKMRATKKALRLVWKLPALSHLSPFKNAVITTDRQVVWKGEISALRLDSGEKTFVLEL